MKRFLAALSIALLTGCATARASDVNEAERYEQFKALAYLERRAEIRSLPVALQVRAYLDMLAESEPPDLGLAFIIAPGGKDLVDVVRGRLEGKASDDQRADLIFLLWAMQQKGYADVRGDEDLLSVLRSTVGSMEDESLKRSSAEIIVRIEGAKHPPSDR